MLPDLSYVCCSSASPVSGWNLECWLCSKPFWDISNSREPVGGMPSEWQRDRWMRARGNLVNDECAAIHHYDLFFSLYRSTRAPEPGESLSPVNRIKNNECLHSDGLTNNSAALVENKEIYGFIFRWHLFSGMLWISHCTWPSDWLPFKHPGHAIYLQTVGCYFEVREP